MRLEQLHHLVEVAKSKSISLAAERIYVSQPAISSSINKLEDELGIMLFKRSNQGVTPTPLGEIVAQKAQEILDNIDEIKQIANANNGALAGNINIAAIPTVYDTIMADILASFNKMYPNVCIMLKEGESINILDDIRSGKADIGIVLKIDEIIGKDISHEELFLDEFVVLVGKNSHLAAHDSISLKDALKYPVITFNTGFVANCGISSILKKYGQPKIAFRFDTLDILKKVIVKDNLVAFAPSFLTQDYLKYDVVPLSINDVRISVSIVSVWSKHHHFSLAEREFVKTLKTMCNEAFNKPREGAKLSQN